MALNSLHIKISVDDLMKKALELNYTKNGEMFDGKFIFIQNYFFITFKTLLFCRIKQAIYLN